ncbi:hypothetical protein EW026_g59 [Hermanssonia centrifuga]|uniref:Conidiation-specific protein 6 n=1 Tax=Hermanssonia centrifuga TaxID=98765 RepID=A0A4S4KVT0_9APHY|nr:hypothetical protein EW026_g59 [Hermanssonia centrifuga]
MSANPGNVAGGLKATISNPHTSEEAKERANERLQDMEESGELDHKEAHDAHVARGRKAALHNPNVSLEAKERSKKALEELEDEI